MENNITKATETATRATLAEYLDSRINANAKIAAESIVAVGRDLKEMRDKKLYKELECSSFEVYCNDMTPIKQRQAYNFIKCYEKYGERLAELSDIGITKLTLMSALDDEDSDALIESGAAEELSVRELEQRVKELQRQNEQLTLDIGKKGEKSKEESKLEKMRNDMEKLKAELAAQKDIQTKKDERIKELEAKPVEVAVEKPSKAEIAEIEKKAAEKAKNAAQKQHDKELAEAVEAAKKENLAEIERLKSENAALQSNAKKAPPTSEKERIKLCLEEVQRNFNLALETIDKLPEEEREKFKGGLKAIVEKMGGVLV